MDMPTANMIINIILAALLGLCVGAERRWHYHEGALHTNMLVCLGSALFVSCGLLVISAHDDTRIIGQIASGIGFLGAGAIMRDGWRVRGLATAATFWCAAAIGALCGIGRYMEAIIASLLLILTNIFVHWLDRKINWPKQQTTTSED